MKTYETEKHNIPEGATHYQDECSKYHFSWFILDESKLRIKTPDQCTNWIGVRLVDYIDRIAPIPQTKEVEWVNGLPPVGSKVMCRYTDTDLEGWCDMHGPSDVIAYHGDYVWVAHHGKFNRVHELGCIEFEKPEAPEDREKRERDESAKQVMIDLCGDDVFKDRDWEYHKKFTHSAEMAFKLADLGYRKGGE